MHDAIVIGARCAGSPTAMLLAREGYRVLLVDKAVFPSDTMSSHYIHQPGVAHLKRWGLLGALRASNCPRIERFSYQPCHPTFGTLNLTGNFLPYEGVDEVYAPRRLVLDKILVDAAVEAGVELREGLRVQELLKEGNTVVGIRGYTPKGSAVSERARIVIGAEGLRSVVAHDVQAPTYFESPVATCFYYSYWSGVTLRDFEFHHLDGVAIVIEPTNDGLINVNIAWRAKEFPNIRADIEGNFLKTIERVPRAAQYLREGRREEPFVGASGFPGFFRKPYGPGWALVGDAGYLRDPATGQGITDAFRDAELLAKAIDDGFSGRKLLGDALAEYEKRRNEIVLPIYKMICLYSTLDLPPYLIMKFLAALRGNQPELDRLVGTISGVVPHKEFFSPAHIGRVLLGDFRRQLGRGLRKGVFSSRNRTANKRKKDSCTTPS